MKKFGIFAIIGYFIPFVFAVLIKYFTKWGQEEVENCIFAFFIGIVLESIIGVFGLIGSCKKGMRKERKLFLLNVVPLIVLGILFIISSCFHLK